MDEGKLGIFLIGPMTPYQHLGMTYVTPRLPFPLTVSQV